jgi:hypothetical protein
MLPKNDASFHRHLSRSNSSCTGRVSKWELFDTKTNKKVMDLVNGTIVYSNDPSFNIRAVVSGSGTRSVVLTLDSGYTQIENTVPYALCGNKGNTYRRCNGLTFGKHTVTGKACCGRGGRGTCQRPLATLVFEIRRPVATPTKTKAPTRAPMKNCRPGVVSINGGCCVPDIDVCCEPGQILAFKPRGPPFDYCCPLGTTLVNYFGDCCRAGDILVTLNDSSVSDFCCPPETTVVGFYVGRGYECCKPGEILVRSSFKYSGGSGICCPAGTIGATFTSTTGVLKFDKVCCPPNTGVNPVTQKCCANGQRECTPKPSPSCAVVGDDGDGNDCCGAGVLVAMSDYTCCPPGQIVAVSNPPLNRPRIELCCPQGTTGVSLFVEAGPASCCLAGNIMVKTAPYKNEVCCPMGTTLADTSNVCCKPDDILVPIYSSPNGTVKCCPNRTMAVGITTAGFVGTECCPPNTGVNPVTKKCCTSGQKECKPTSSCAVVGNDGDGDDCCGAGVLAVTSDFKCCPPGQIVSFSNPYMENGYRIERCCPPKEALVGSVDGAANCCPAGSGLAKLSNYEVEKCCPDGVTLADSNRKCCQPGEILAPFLKPGSKAVYCCPAGTNVSAYNADYTKACCPPNTGANLKTNQCCPVGQMSC